MRRVRARVLQPVGGQTCLPCRPARRARARRASRRGQRCPHRRRRRARLSNQSETTTAERLRPSAGLIEILRKPTATAHCGGHFCCDTLQHCTIGAAYPTARALASRMGWSAQADVARVSTPSTHCEYSVCPIHYPVKARACLTPAKPRSAKSSSIHKPLPPAAAPPHARDRVGRQPTRARSLARSHPACLAWLWCRPDADAQAQPAARVAPCGRRGAQVERPRSPPLARRGPALGDIRKAPRSLTVDAAVSVRVRMDGRRTDPAVAPTPRGL